jgi:hypothetical protein
LLPNRGAGLPFLARSCRNSLQHSYLSLGIAEAALQSFPSERGIEFDGAKPVRHRQGLSIRHMSKVNQQLAVMTILCFY